MDDTVGKVLFAVLGFAFGVAGPIIVDANKRRKENAEGRAAILTELREVGCVLACAAWSVRCNMGTMDRAFLEWFKNDVERHAVSEQYKPFPAIMQKLLSWNELQLAEWNQHNKAENEEEGRGLILQLSNTPLLDARVSALTTFDTDFQRKLHQVRQNLGIINDHVARSRMYHDMTFTLQGGQLDKAIGNMRQIFGLYADQAKKTVDLIRKLAG